MSLTKVTYAMINGAPVNVFDFGAVGDGITDDSSALNAALAYAQANGAEIYVPAGTYSCSNLRLENGVSPWKMTGAGKGLTTFKNRTGEGSLFNGPSSSVGYTLEGFTVDCQYSLFPSAVDARNGFSISNTSNVTLKDIHVTNYKLSGILVFATTANIYKNNKMIGCSVDALNVGTNGMLFVDMDECVYINCTAKGAVYDAVNGPGIGVQFKNNCRYGSAVDCYAENCFVGIGLAGDTSGLVQGPAYNTLSNCRTFNCFSGIRIGNGSVENALTNFVINHNDQNSSDPIDIQSNSVGNSLTNIIALNIGASRRAVQFRTDATDNYVEFGHLANMNTSAIVAYFDTTSLRNRVRLRRQSNPVLRSGGIQSMATFADVAANGNSFTYDDYVPTESRTISSGVIVVRNAATQSLLVDTEGSAATDDLDTITTYGQVGQIIYVQTVNDARDVVVKHNTGNILLTGAADVTLPNRRSYIVLTYNVYSAKWIELYQAINP